MQCEIEKVTEFYVQVENLEKVLISYTSPKQRKGTKALGNSKSTNKTRSRKKTWQLAMKPYESLCETCIKIHEIALASVFVPPFAALVDVAVYPPFVII